MWTTEPNRLLWPAVKCDHGERSLRAEGHNGMGLEDRIRRMDEQAADTAARAAGLVAQDRQRAILANRLLDRLVAQALPILRTRGHGKFLEVAYELPILSFAKIKIIPGQTIWRTTYGSGYLGITDAGVLVNAVPHPAKTIQGKIIGGLSGAVDLHRRAVELARQRGFDAAVHNPEPIRAFGHPQPSTHPDSCDPSVFYLDGAENLVYGTRTGSIDAEEWMAKAIH